MAINVSAQLRKTSPASIMQVWRTAAAPLKILIVQSDLKSAQALADLFTERGNQVWQASRAEGVPSLLQQHRPDWVGIDLHLPDESWQKVWHAVRQSMPGVKV